MVERNLAKVEVTSSSLVTRSKKIGRTDVWLKSQAKCAGVAQLVERDLAKVEVTSSSLVTRSKFTGDSIIRISRFLLCGPDNPNAARVAKSVNAADLKSAAPKGAYGFKSRPGHHGA